MSTILEDFCCKMTLKVCTLGNNEIIKEHSEKTSNFLQSTVYFEIISSLKLVGSMAFAFWDSNYKGVVANSSP